MEFDSDMKTMFQFDRVLAAVVVAMGVLWLAGCGAPPKAGTKPLDQATSEGESRLRAGDPLQIRVETSPTQPTQASEVTVDDDGFIALPLIGRLKASGLTTSELAEKIQKAYVPQYYVRCTATVLAPVRYFYIGGEVKNPGRFPWSKDMSLLKAISTGSGFTDFANRTKVELTRGRAKTEYDCDDIRRHPEKDVPIQPGDSIYVARSIF
jgi:polysaccharide export outer membrane protein